MESFTTYEKHNYFSISMSDYDGNFIDNKDAHGLRLILLLIEGEAGMAILNGKSVPYITPCVFCINEQEHILISEANDSRVRAIYFHPNIINSGLDFENIRELPKDVSVTFMQDCGLVQYFVHKDCNFIGKFNLGPLSIKKFTMLFDGIHRLIHEQVDENWPCRSRSYLMEILFLLDNLYMNQNFFHELYIESVEEDFSPILLYIYNNYDKKITVQDITMKFFVSRTTLSKMFQLNVGQSFLSYLNKMRIAMASTMLRDTLLPINEIMLRVGFYDNAHFLRMFKKHTGMSPSMYREKYNWM